MKDFKTSEKVGDFYNRIQIHIMNKNKLNTLDTFPAAGERG